MIQKRPSPDAMLRAAKQALRDARRKCQPEAIAVAQQLVRVLERRAARASSMPVAERARDKATADTIGDADALGGTL